MATDRDSYDNEPPHASSPTADIIENLELNGFHPARGEHDPRLMPEPLTVHGALADVFDALVSTFTDTPLERDLEQLLWSTVLVFHRIRKADLAGDAAVSQPFSCDTGRAAATLSDQTVPFDRMLL